jgi:hypothetical protein
MDIEEIRQLPLPEALQTWFGEPMEVEEVEAALERYAETGLQHEKLDDPHHYYRWLWSSILEARAAQHPDETVFLLPTDDRCSRTDGFCPIKEANKDCRTCQFYQG